MNGIKKTHTHTSNLLAREENPSNDYKVKYVIVGHGNGLGFYIKYGKEVLSVLRRIMTCPHIYSKKIFLEIMWRIL